MADTRELAFSLSDLNPLHWLGSAASAAIGDVWKAAMTALWSAGLWVLGLAFKIIDAFTTPDLSTTGPLARVLPYTFAIGALLAVLLGLVQIGVAVWKRDGQSIARVMVGVVQFWGVWIGYVSICAVLVTATSGLTKGLLTALLHVNGFSGVPASANWPTKIDDTVVATVLGLCTIFVIFPAAIGYVLLMLVREAALLILASTSPISAAGLLSESTRAWFWKSFRWFLATLLMAPLAALVLGIGIQICEGTIKPPKKPTLPPQCHGNPLTSRDCLKAAGQAANNFTTQQVGMAVTGCLIILIGAICPLLLFRLLAFVDPGTPSGAAMRASFAANGGMAGLLSGKGASAGGGGGDSAGSGAATKQDGGGRSAGEASADTQTASRFSGMLGGAGQAMGAGMQAVGKVTSKAASIGSDVLGSSGVGHQAPYMGQDSDSSSGAASGGSSSPGTGAAPGTGNGGGDDGSGGAGGSGGGDGGTPPTPPTPPMPQPPTPPTGGGGGGGLPGMPGGGPGGAAGGAEGAGAAAEVPVVVPV